MRVVPARVHLPGDPALVLPLHGLLQPRTRRQGRQVLCRAWNGQLPAPTFQSSVLLCLVVVLELLSVKNCPFWAVRRIDSPRAKSACLPPGLPTTDAISGKKPERPCL
jgi:hypothetical protein